MQCPKCRFENDPQVAECTRCGVIFARYVPRSKDAVSVPTRRDEDPEARYTERREVLFRLFAVPSALLGARVLVSMAPAAVRMLSMWIHEFGHAMTAWLCGFSAIPGPWFTPVGVERSSAVTIILAGLIGFGSVRAWRNRRLALATAGVATLILQLLCTFKLYSDQAQQLIIFGGDAGCFLLGSALMATFYIRRQSIIYGNSLRWAFLVIGALAFMDAFTVWSGGIARVPFGENENGLSDPSVLTELYGWNVNLLMSRYHRLAVTCLLGLAAIYTAGVAIAFQATKAEQTGPSPDYP